MSARKIPTGRFFNEYHGHPTELLDNLIGSLPAGRSVLYLVGDSTLDNKHWLRSGASQTACNGYERVLSHPSTPGDVAHWLNHELVQRGLGDRAVCVNAAIEESTLGLRHGGKLLPHDEFVRRHISAPDVLIVSCGGNDIALRPTCGTIAAMATLVSCPKWLISSGLAPGLGHFKALFRDSTKAYIESLIAERRPRIVVCCMLYYLDTRPGGSWADQVLSKLGYNSDPAKLQLIMRMIYEQATCAIQINGTTVVPVPLYEALDGTDTDDYVERVEPSVQGGEKMAKVILDRLEPHLKGAASQSDSQERRRRTSEPETVSMPASVHDRDKGLW